MTPGPIPLTVPAGDVFITVVPLPSSNGATSLYHTFEIDAQRTNFVFVAIQAAYGASGNSQDLCVTLACNPSDIIINNGKISVPVIVTSSSAWGDLGNLVAVSGWTDAVS